MGNLKTCDGTVYQPKPHVCGGCGKSLSWQTKGDKCIDCLKPDLRERMEWVSSFKGEDRHSEQYWKMRMAYVRSFRGKK